MTGAEMLVAANGWWFGSIVFVILWILIAFWPARVAARKGHSFFGFFLFSLVFFPAALIVAYLVHDRTEPAWPDLPHLKPTPTTETGGTRCSEEDGPWPKWQQ